MNDLIQLTKVKINMNRMILAVIIVITAVYVFGGGLCTGVVFAETHMEKTELKSGENQLVKKEIAPKEFLVIAHGGGSIDGYETTNSKEALVNSINKGAKYIELDMDFSKDGKIIMIHDFGRTTEHYYGTKFTDKLTAYQFSNILVNGKFHTMNFEDLVCILNKNENLSNQVKIITDTKGDNISLLTEIAEKYPEMIDRIIPQIYDYDQYEKVKALGYENIIFTLYALDRVKYNELVSFVKQNQIWAVAVGNEFVVKDLEKKLPRDGISVFCHPVSSYEDAQRLRKYGVKGVYSGILQAEEFLDVQRIYFLQKNLAGGNVKLTDLQIKGVSFSEIKAISIVGNKGEGTLSYYIADSSGKFRPMEEKLLNELPEGKYVFRIEFVPKLTNNILQKMKEDYILWKDSKGLRILDKRFEYRLEGLLNYPSLSNLDSDKEISTEQGQKMLQVLKDSFVAKQGEYYYFNKTECKRFQVGNDLLRAQKYVNGEVIVPLTTSVSEIGKDRVTMGTGRYLYIKSQGKRIVACANSFYINNNGINEKVETPITIYRKKAMSSGETLKIISGRDYITDKNVLIVLPEKVKISRAEEKVLLKLANDAFPKAV